ncbi:unnamed protein product [Sphagnum tenellum]
MDLLRAVDADDYGFGAESSDAGVACTAPTGGYRAVPSDTDDASASATTASAADSASARRSGRRLRKAGEHDEEWFDAHDSKWWRAGRQTCFWAAIAAMALASVAAAVLIYYMPRKCDPRREWFQGVVFMDLRPTLTEDKYLFDLEQNAQKLQEIGRIGIRAVHLKGLTPLHAGATTHDDSRPTELFLDDYLKVFGRSSSQELEASLTRFVDLCHASNLSVVAQIAVVPAAGSGDNDEGKGVMSVQPRVRGRPERRVLGAARGRRRLPARARALRQRQLHRADARVLEIGVQEVRRRRHPRGVVRVRARPPGLCPRGPGALAHQPPRRQPRPRRLLPRLLLWRRRRQPGVHDRRLGQRGRSPVDQLEHPRRPERLQGRARLPVPAARDSQRAGDGNEVSDTGMGMETEDVLKNLTSIRGDSVPIYMNGNYKRCECEGGTVKEPNLEVKEPQEGLLQLERFYSRRNRFLLVANLGAQEASLLKVADMYSAGELVLDTGRRLLELLHAEVKIKDLRLGPGDAFVIKLPK